MIAFIIFITSFLVSFHSLPLSTVADHKLSETIQNNWLFKHYFRHRLAFILSLLGQRQTSFGVGKDKRKKDRRKKWRKKIENYYYEQINGGEKRNVSTPFAKKK